VLSLKNLGDKENKVRRMRGKRRRRGWGTGG
jgi:hypothetical protein